VETGFVVEAGIVVETGVVVEAGIVVETGFVVEAGIVVETGFVVAGCDVLFEDIILNYKYILYHNKLFFFR
jgi:hypothetical protein